MKIYTKGDFVTSKWEGGESTQLFIYPQESTIAEANFSIRISTATVDKEESTFSTFPGYKRFLVPLTGELKLVHKTVEGEFEQNLRPMELCVFNAEWITKSVGKVTDFNVIFNPSIEVSLTHFSLTEDKKIIPATIFTENVIFIFKGELQFRDITLTNESIISLQTNEFELIQSTGSVECLILSYNV